MRKFLFIISLSMAYCLMAQGQQALEYDTIIDRGIYKSFYNRRYNTPSFVTYKLYHGGGRVKRGSMSFYQSVSGDIYHYRGSGYDRGHLCPAADMARTKNAMRLTFDHLNIIPQLPALNRGEWKHDETLVRKWSQKDSLLIECGGLDFDTIRHQVPAWCYKIVVNLATGDTLLNKKYRNKKR